MIYNLVIDADSMLYQSCYRHQDIDLMHWHPELAYKDMVSNISGIESAVYKQYDLQKTDKLTTEIIFSPKKVFRHDIYDDYKANRPPVTLVGISELKQMISIRLGMTQVENIEADDLVITRAYEKENVIISCIDKDILDHSPVECFNYKKWEWSPALDQETIEQNYLLQGLLGDSSDNIKGAKGIGKAKAPKLVYSIDGFGWDEFVTKFNSEDEAIMTMRLVRLDQYTTKGGLKLWEP